MQSGGNQHFFSVYPCVRHWQYASHVNNSLHTPTIDMMIIRPIFKWENWGSGDEGPGLCAMQIGNDKSKI